MFKNLAKQGIKRLTPQPNADLQIIKKYHPEVLIRLSLLAIGMGINPKWLDNFYTKNIVPSWISSGYRDCQYDSEVSNSPHCFGIAIDIVVGKTIRQFEWAREATETTKLFARAGLYPQQNILHLDIADKSWCEKYRGTLYWVKWDKKYTGFYDLGSAMRYAWAKIDGEK